MIKALMWLCLAISAVGLFGVFRPFRFLGLSCNWHWAVVLMAGLFAFVGLTDLLPAP